MDKLIFNCSMPRSGSELIQVILHQNPRIYASTTSPLHAFLTQTQGILASETVRSQNKNIMRKGYMSMCKHMTEGWYKGITDRPVVIDKSRDWSSEYEWINEWNRDPKIICMVRDLRSIAASMERNFRKNKHNSFMEQPNEMQNLTVLDRVNTWLNGVPVGLSLKRIQNLFQKRLDGKIFFIKYEDFCKDPDSWMPNIYDFIGEELYLHDYNNIIKEIEEDDSAFGIFGNHQVRQVLEEPKPNDWEDMIDENIAFGIRDSFSWYFDAFGYV